MLIRSGVGVLKYWFSVSDDEQERRFQARAADPKRRWKLSPMDIESRDRWVDYSRAKDAMFEYTDTKDCPWYVVNADDKKRARLNCISHILERSPTRMSSSPDQAATPSRARRLHPPAARVAEARPGAFLRVHDAERLTSFARSCRRNLAARRVRQLLDELDLTNRARHALLGERDQSVLSSAQLSWRTPSTSPGLDSMIPTTATSRPTLQHSSLARPDLVAGDVDLVLIVQSR